LQALASARPVSDTVSITTKTNLQNKPALATVIVGYAA
jgi:hypothetical protein